MTDVIHIPHDPAQAGIRQFVESSMLADCTTITEDGGVLTVTSRWPVAAFSRGEQVGWMILGDLVRGNLRTFLNAVDSDSIGALIAALALTREAVYA